MNPFDQWAGLYDSVYSYVTEDISFYVEEAQRARGPVLELGCGTGRIAIPVAQADVEIVGLDSSTAMLEVARSKLAKAGSVKGNLTFIQGDMRDFSLKRRFELVIVPFRGFLSLLSVEDERRTLVNIQRHLAPGGRLIFSIFVPDLNMLVQEGDLPYHYRDVTDPATGRRLLIWHQSRCDNYNQIVNARIIVEELDGDGIVIQKQYRDFQLRYMHRWEAQHLLEFCGFEVLELYGDFDHSPFDETRTEMIWVARPRE